MILPLLQKQDYYWNDGPCEYEEGVATFEGYDYHALCETKGA